MNAVSSPAPASAISVATAPVVVATQPPAQPARAMPATWTVRHTLALVGIVGVLVLVGIGMPALGPASRSHSTYQLWAWLAALVLLGAFVAIAGEGLTGRWCGALIDERNRMSLSRLQMIVWTLVVLSGFLAAALTNLHGRFLDALAIAVPGELWTLMGITSTALIGSPLLLSLKRVQSADTEQAAETLSRLVPDAASVSVQDGRVSGTASSGCDITHQGQVVVNRCVQDAQWSDLFRGDETGNAAHLDLGKVQMFYFTLIVALAYTVALGSLFAHSTGRIPALPQLDQSMVALLAISNAGYLTNKVVPHSASAAN